MKTTINPGSAGSHAQSSTANDETQIPLQPAWRKKLVGSLGVLLMLGFAVHSTKEAKSDDNRERDKKLPGTWNVTLRFPECSAICPCPAATLLSRSPAELCSVTLTGSGAIRYFARAHRIANGNHSP